MEAKGKCPAKRTPQTGFPSLFQGPLGAGSSGTAAISSATALAGTSALPSSLPAQSWLCFVHHIPLLPGLQFPDPGSSQPSGAAPCCFPGTLGVDTRRQGHTAQHGPLPALLQGLTAFISLGIWWEGSNQCSGTAFGRSALAPSHQSL